jgi:hypothetical protein
MSKIVISGATLQCSQGTSTGSLTVLPTNSTSSDDEPAATIDDYIPMTNIPTFGMCQTESNPQVAAATASAEGVLTPQPCIPVVTSAWSPGSTAITINGTKALRDDSTCNCQWSGSISITAAGTEVEAD